MRTRKATEAEKAAYNELRNNSENWRVVKENSDKFYANKVSWEGLDKELALWSAACKRWKEEVTSAGFYLSSIGIRIIIAK